MSILFIPLLIWFLVATTSCLASISGSVVRPVFLSIAPPIECRAKATNAHHKRAAARGLKAFENLLVKSEDQAQLFSTAQILAECDTKVAEYQSAQHYLDSMLGWMYLRWEACYALIQFNQSWPIESGWAVVSAEEFRKFWVLQPPHITGSITMCEGYFWYKEIIERVVNLPVSDIISRIGGIPYIGSKGLVVPPSSILLAIVQARRAEFDTTTGGSVKSTDPRSKRLREATDDPTEGEEDTELLDRIDSLTLKERSSKFTRTTEY